MLGRVGVELGVEAGSQTRVSVRVDSCFLDFIFSCSSFRILFHSYPSPLLSSNMRHVCTCTHTHSHSRCAALTPDSRARSVRLLVVRLHAPLDCDCRRSHAHGAAAAAGRIPGTREWGWVSEGWRGAIIATTKKSELAQSSLRVHQKQNEFRAAYHAEILHDVCVSNADQIKCSIHPYL